jgi:aspergillopepsin I
LKYLLPIAFGNQTLDAELDTGSSDTWLIQTGFQCYDTADQTTNTFSSPEPASSCNFGGTYSPDAAFEPEEGLFQLSCYGSSAENTQRCVGGEVGVTSVTLCGLTVPQQLVGAPNNSSYPAQGLAEQSGIIGLAFPTLSGINNSTENGIPYATIMDTFFEVATFTPPLAKQFSLAISRDTSGTGNGGTFTIGGIPSLTDPAVNVSSQTSTSAAFQYITGISTTNYSFYSILIDSFVLGASTLDAGLQVIVDSGANAIEASTATANAINSAWSPAIDSNGNLDCNAILTEPFGVAIGGTTYYIESADLIAQNPDGTCQSLVAAGSDGNYLIGDPLLRNVLAVYDWQDSVMSFYPRMYYAS